MRHIKLFENWFQEIEDQVEQGKETDSIKEPVKTEEPAEKEEVSEPAPEPETFEGWLKSQPDVVEVVEAEETDKSSRAWVKFKNGVSTKWSIDMADYPSLEASFKLNDIIIQLEDDPAGDFARALNKGSREYIPREWDKAVLAASLQVPDVIADVQENEDNRISTMDSKISKIITDLYK